MPNTLVTLITRTKDRALFIPRVFETVVQQSYRPIEWIIVNDNGVSIVDLIEALKSKFEKELDGIEIKLINKDISNGMEAASNTGLKYAHGVFVKLLDDDDTLDKECIKKQVKYMENDKLPSEKGVICYTQIIFEDVTDDIVTILDHKPLDHTPKSISINQIAKENKFTIHSFLYERNVFEVLETYDESLPVLGDWEFNLRFIMNFDIGVLPEFLVNYHKRVKSESHSNTDTHLHGKYTNVIRNRYMREGKEYPVIASVISTMPQIESLNQKLDFIKNNQSMLKQNDQTSVDTLTAMLQPNIELADILREIAFLFENKKDIKTALSIMEEAYVHRPDGPNIRKKIEEYKNFCSQGK